VSDCYVLLCTEIFNAGYRRFVRTFSISYHRRKVIREGIILFRNVGTSIPNSTVSVARRHQSCNLIYLLHVQVSSDNLLFNSPDGVCSVVSVLLFLPHTLSLSLSLSLSCSLYFHVSLQSAPHEYADRRHVAIPLSEHLRRSPPRNAVDCNSLSSLIFGYKNFSNASFEALHSGHYLASVT